MRSVPVTFFRTLEPRKRTRNPPSSRYVCRRVCGRFGKCDDTNLRKCACGREANPEGGVDASLTNFCHTFVRGERIYNLAETGPVVIAFGCTLRFKSVGSCECLGRVYDMFWRLSLFFRTLEPRKRTQKLPPNRHVCGCICRRFETFDATKLAKMRAQSNERVVGQFLSHVRAHKTVG